MRGSSFVRVYLGFFFFHNAACPYPIFHPLGFSGNFVTLNLTCCEPLLCILDCGLPVSRLVTKNFAFLFLVISDIYNMLLMYSSSGLRTLNCHPRLDSGIHATPIALPGVCMMSIEPLCTVFHLAGPVDSSFTGLHLRAFEKYCIGPWPGRLK